MKASELIHELTMLIDDMGDVEITPHIVTLIMTPDEDCPVVRLRTLRIVGSDDVKTNCE